jgi:hypothetical protein
MSGSFLAGKPREADQGAERPICGVALVAQPVKTLSPVLLPWREEEVKVGDFPPHLNPLPRRGED